MINLIAAYGGGRALGYQGDMPWGKDMQSDMRRFRELTINHTVIMGRLTFESIGKPLPKRRNVVVSQHVLHIAGCEVVGSVDDALGLVQATDDSPFFIGGARIYHEALPRVARMYITEVDADFPADTYFPEFDVSEWHIMADETHEADTANAYPYRFITYERMVHD